MGQYFAELALSNNDIVNGTWQSNVPFIPTNGWTASRTVVPVPAAVWLFGSGLIGLVGLARRKNTRIALIKHYAIQPRHRAGFCLPDSPLCAVYALSLQTSVGPLTVHS